MKLLTNLDLSRNEIKNVVIHNLPSHPSEQKEGQVYFNTSQNQHYAYRNGKWTVLGSDSIADIIGLQDALDSKGSIVNEHNHKNKADLDSITDTRLSNWDIAYRDNHIHEHKAILDGIDEDRVTKWDNSVEDAKDYTDAQILEINGGAPSSSNSLKKISDTLDAHKESIDTLDALAKTKADDKEMKAALDTKANKEDMNRELALRAVKTEVNNALSLKADAEETTNSLAQKADKTETEIALSHKVDNTYLSKNYYTGAITDDKLRNIETNLKAYVDELGETKASASDVRALSLTKADDEEIKSILATKANLVEVNNELSAKADAKTVNSELEKKALKSVVDQMNVDLSSAINTKMDIHTHPYKSENWYPTWNDVTGKPELMTPAMGSDLETRIVANAKSYTDEAVANLVDSAPETLNTLQELSSALGNDPNFATSITGQLGRKADTEYVNTEMEKKANLNNPHFTGNSFSYGRKSGTVEGESSVVLGTNSEATNFGAIAIGGQNRATGGRAIAIGSYTAATGTQATALGVDTLASGIYSFVTGKGSRATNESSTAMGYSTTCDGVAATTLGSSSYANGWGAMSSGIATKAYGMGQHVFGAYNIPDENIDNHSDKREHLMIVGNGNSSTLSNAYTLDWNGNGWYQGNVEVDGTPTADNHVVTKKYVEDMIEGINSATTTGGTVISEQRPIGQVANRIWIELI